MPKIIIIGAILFVICLLYLYRYLDYTSGQYWCPRDNEMHNYCNGDCAGCDECEVDDGS